MPQKTQIQYPLWDYEPRVSRNKLQRSTNNPNLADKTKQNTDRLMHVPNVQPPQPGDWEVHPTHPTHHTPYQLAQFWDRGVRQRVEDRTAKLQAQRKAQQLKSGSATGLGVGQVPRDLRETAKRSPAVRGWVRALEEPVRLFLRAPGQGDNEKREEEEEKQKEKDKKEKKKKEKEKEKEVSDSDDYDHDGHHDRPSSSEGVDGKDATAVDVQDGLDSEDEEIVFVGRRGAMKELREKKAAGGWKKAHREVEQQKVDSGMVFDSFDNDEGASFK